MAFENLTERFQSVFKNLRGKKKLTGSDIQDLTKEIRTALLEADVALSVVKTFIKKIRERALGAELSEALDPSQQFIQIVNEELTSVLGGGEADLLKSPKIPTIIMMVGLQGAGKTTFAGKLAKRLKEEEGARPLMIAADVYRPAAIDQLKTLGDQLSIPVYEEGVGESPVNIVKHGLQVASNNKNDYVLVDTAGRLEIDDRLMNELLEIKDLAQPTEILLVLDAMTGQVAAQVAKTFDDILSITGVILTKLDGDTRGGAALSIREITGKPIKFTGTGEKLSDLEVFYPDRMSSRILGMGDILTLIEKTQAQYDEDQAQLMAEKMAENRFDFSDFVEQLDQVQSMGPIDELMKMIPGMNQLPQGAAANMQVDEKEIVRQKAIVLSMTPAERGLEVVLSPARRRRIAAGSGNSYIEVNKFIKQFNQSKDMMQAVMNGDMSQMMSAMGQKNLPPGAISQGMPDMSALQEMMGMDGKGLPGLGGRGEMPSMFGGGLKGRATELVMKSAMKKAQKKMKKKRKK